MKLLESLLIYESRYPAEGTVVKQFIDLIETGQGCFDRHNLHGHFTGSAWVLNMDFTETLLVHHRKLGKWIQPGGHADGEPDLQRVAERELREESGLEEVFPLGETIFDIDVHHIPAPIGGEEHYHYDVRYLFRARDTDPLRVSDESHELRWVALDCLEEFTREESLLRMRWKSRNPGIELR